MTISVSKTTHRSRQTTTRRRPSAAETQAQEPVESPDAEPATVTDAPPLVPPIEHDPLPEADSAEIDGEEAESFAARRQRLQGRRKQARRGSRWTAVILVLVAFNVALVGARNEVVHYLPQTASLFAAIGLPVNLRHLKFENVKISKETQDGIDLLVVEGAVVSEAGKPVEVPRLRFAARNKTGQEVYTWTMRPPRSILSPGERMEFRSQIPAPPADGERRDGAFLHRARRRGEVAHDPEKLPTMGTGFPPRAGGRTRSCARIRIMAKILVAEDDDMVRDLVVRALNEDGHELTVAGDGFSALAALNRKNIQYDLLLTDVKMPVMDGIALALAAGRDHPDVAIMLMTAFADQRERAHGLDALVHDVIAKPFSVDQIKGAVREALVPRH